MSPGRPRAETLPNANDPRLLLRMVRLVSTGLRRTRALADVLDVDIRTIHYYTQAGEWLGLMVADPDVRLLGQGLELAFADDERQWAVYAKAVWANPHVRQLMGRGTELPSIDDVTAFVLEVEPDLAPTTARRRASAMRGLMTPAMDEPGLRRPGPGEQLQLPFGRPVALEVKRTPPVDRTAGDDDSPDVYGLLLMALLDSGELTTGNIRGLLDNAGAGDCALGGYMEMALRRGDAVRLDDRLVATMGACSRAGLAADPALIALSDPSYRAYLASVRGGTADRALARRFAPWDHRFLKGPAQRDTLDAALQRCLVHRRLESLPVAGPGGLEPAGSPRPFLEALDSTISIAFPRNLSVLGSGLQALNTLLKRNREAPAAVRPTSAMDPRSRVHGGLLHPREPLPRNLPDLVSLRLRAISNTPAISILTGLLVLDRKGATPIRIMAESGALLRGKQRLGPLVAAMCHFAASQPWVSLHPPSGGLSGEVLAVVAQRLGLATAVGPRLVLDEGLFARLQEDPEARLVYDALQPLCERLHAWVDGLSGPIAPEGA